jgi:hypothetical protein
VGHREDVVGHEVGVVAGEGLGVIAVAEGLEVIAVAEGLGVIAVAGGLEVIAAAEGLEAAGARGGSVVVVVAEDTEVVVSEGHDVVFVYLRREVTPPKGFDKHAKDWRVAVRYSRLRFEGIDFLFDIFKPC